MHAMLLALWVSSLAPCAPPEPRPQPVSRWLPRLDVTAGEGELALGLRWDWPRQRRPLPTVARETGVVLARPRHARLPLALEAALRRAELRALERAERCR